MATVDKVREEMYAHVLTCEKCRDEKQLDASTVCQDLQQLKDNLFKDSSKDQKTSMARELLLGAFWHWGNKEKITAFGPSAVNFAKAVITDTDTMYLTAYPWSKPEMFKKLISVLENRDNRNVTVLNCHSQEEIPTTIMSALSCMPYLKEIGFQGIQLSREMCVKIEECCPLVERIVMIAVKEENAPTEVSKLPQLSGCTLLHYIRYNLEAADSTIFWHPRRVINNIRHHESFKLQLRNGTVSAIQSFEQQFPSWIPRLSHVLLHMSTPGTITKCFATFVGLYELHLEKCNAACLHVLLSQRSIQMRSLKICCMNVNLEVADLLNIFPNLEDMAIELGKNDNSTITFTPSYNMKSSMKSAVITNTEPVILVEILERLPLLKKLHVAAVSDTYDQLKEILETCKNLEDLKMKSLPNIPDEIQDHEQLVSNCGFAVCIGKWHNSVHKK